MSSTVRNKWKRGFSKLKQREDSNVSLASLSQQSSVMEEEISDSEVENYLSRLKKKTGLRNLWSGNKFEKLVEDDKTPDISTDSDDELDLKLSMNAEHFRQLTLDSDEDEMRIDFMRHASLHKIDENNNEIESDVSEDGNFMQNIRFAELEIAEVELSDSELKVKKHNDFLPNLYTLDNDNVNKSSSESQSSFAIGRNVHVLDEISDSEHDFTLSKDKEIRTESIKTDSVSSIASKTSSAHSKSSNRHTKRSRTSNHPSHSENYSDDTYNTSSYTSSMSSRIKNKSKSNQTSRSASSQRTINDNYDSDTIISTTSSISSDNVKKSSASRSKSKRAKDCDRKKTVRQYSSKSKSTSTQTSSQYDPLTEKVRNFRYHWQDPSPSNIAIHAVDMATLDVMTNYSPATLATNNMLKFHLNLLKDHIDSSQKLYDSYASESVNKTYKYTTIEDTIKYMKRNRPKVITYEEALKEVETRDN